MIFCTTKEVFCDYTKLCFSNENLSFYTINNIVYEQFDVGIEIKIWTSSFWAIKLYILLIIDSW